MEMPTPKHPTMSDAKAAARASSERRSSSTSIKSNMMSYRRVMAGGLVVALLLLCGGGGLTEVDALKCYMCGQYNEGVGSITPCLNYSEKYAPLYLKECTKSSEKYCVKYVSELSVVRDCATECVEKEIWETQTYCCNEDGCNGSFRLERSVTLIVIPLMVLYALTGLLVGRR